MEGHGHSHGMASNGSTHMIAENDPFHRILHYLEEAHNKQHHADEAGSASATPKVLHVCKNISFSTNSLLGLF